MKLAENSKIDQNGQLWVVKESIIAFESQTLNIFSWIPDLGSQYNFISSKDFIIVNR